MGGLGIYWYHVIIRVVKRVFNGSIVYNAVEGINLETFSYSYRKFDFGKSLLLKKIEQIIILSKFSIWAKGWM